MLYFTLKGLGIINEGGKVCESRLIARAEGVRRPGSLQALSDAVHLDKFLVPVSVYGKRAKRTHVRTQRRHEYDDDDGRTSALRVNI